MSKRYTLEEDAVIADEILMHRKHIKTGLRIAADRLGRTYSSVRSRWYNHLSRDTSDVLPESSVRPMVSPKKGLLGRILSWLGIR